MRFAIVGECAMRASFGLKRQCTGAVKRARGFWKNARGNVAMIFALSLVPLSLAAGAGLDYARAIVVRSNMGQALDAAALAVGSTSGLSTSQMQTMAQQYFNANYKADASYGTPGALNFPTTGANSFQITVSDSMPTTILTAVGINTLPVSASTTVVWGQTKLWVSLVLDNTGSMCQSDSSPNASSPCPSPASGTKIYQLQQATHGLLNMLQSAAANAGDVQVAIVPFINVVNIGTTYAGSSWIDWTDWDAANGSCNISGWSTSTQSGCISTHGTWSSTGGTCNIPGISSQYTCQSTHGTWTTVSSCSKSQYTTRTQCTGHGGTWQTTSSCNISGINTQSLCTSTYGTWTPTGSCNISGYSTQSSCQAAVGIWTPDDHSTWNGCVMDRGSDSGPDTTNNYDVMNTAPVSGTATSLFAAVQCQQSGGTTYPQSLMSLNYNWTSLSSKVDAMVATGSTNQTIGLAWGWHALSQSDPLDAAALPANTARYIIILSDGLNTQDRWYGNGYSQSTQVDSRMSLVCTNAKADGIIIYAVFVDIGGTQGNSTVLQNCATDSSKYFDLTSATQIQAAFNTIGQQITNLHVLH
jgi:Flp pilus assembly protein TadG